MRIRPFATPELDTLIKLFHDSVRKVASRDYSFEEVLAWAPDEADRDAWALGLAKNSTWVTAEGGQLTGFASLEPDGHLDMLYVHAEFQRSGIATALLGRVESSARARGLARLFTEASITARPFFERRGFSLIAMQTVARRGQELRNFRMDRRVG